VGVRAQGWLLQSWGWNGAVACFEGHRDQYRQFDAQNSQNRAQN
jgi:hypothetical protein